jgi:hypothetical protein
LTDEQVKGLLDTMNRIDKAYFDWFQSTQLLMISVPEPVLVELKKNKADNYKNITILSEELSRRFNEVLLTVVDKPSEVPVKFIDPMVA